jgi:hypothetical protein
MKTVAAVTYWVFVAILFGFAMGVGRAIGGELYRMFS